ncbi:MAG: hypothetical protein KC425_15145 [Anaerolineales bacterium]|nr:hypothetical protein [Anaerolineales bacterium]
MTNPFTRFLSQWSTDGRLQAFVAHWDRLERVMVQVYREQRTPADARAEFEAVWPWLRRAYEGWEGELRPFWQQTRAGGAPTQTDPFRLLLAIERPAAILGDWRAMQHLPAAREALNQLVLSRGG